MLKVNLFVVLMLGTIASIWSQQQNQKLDVLVLYESLCPDSEAFMAKQLGPSYDSLKDLIDITLVPFGKSQSQNNGAHFFCQHGPAECEGNRMQSCVLHQTSDQPTQVNFVVCQMTTSDKSTVKYCAESTGLSSNIDACMRTDMGTLLQLQAEQITKQYQPSFVPTIIYNRVFDQQLQDNSIRDFRSTVCSLLQKRGVISFHSEACQ